MDKKTLSVSATLAFCLCFLLSRRAQLTNFDGPPLDIIGFPFYWAQDTFFSLESYVSLPALACNYLFYLLVSIPLALVLVSKVKGRSLTIIRRTLWTLATLIAILQGLVVFLYPHFKSWLPVDETLQIVNPHFAIFPFIG